MNVPDQKDRFPLSEIQQCITHRFRAQVVRYPNEIALQTPSGQLNYRELDQLSDRYARGLIEAGLKPQDRVVLLLEQGCQQIAAMLGVIKCCAIYVPLQARDPISQLKATLLDADPQLLLCDLQNKALSNLLADTNQGVICLADMESSDQKEITLPEGNPHHLVYIYYTSGTTGLPKGVMDNHINILHNVRRYSNSLEINQSDKLTLVQSCEFSGAVSNIFTALLNGAVLLPIDLHQLSVRNTALWLIESGATIYHSVPGIYRQLLKRRLQFPSLRIVRLEGDSAVLEDIRLFQSTMASHCKLIHGLGATETGIIAQYSIRIDSEIDSATVPLGLAASEMAFSIVDTHGRQVPQGSVGEIAVTSDYLACGYRNQSTLSARKFRQTDIQRTYFTGDLGWVSSEGLLHYAGRVSDDKTAPGTSWPPDVYLSQRLVHLENKVSRLTGVEACIVVEAAQPPSKPLRHIDIYVEQDGSCGKETLLSNLFALGADETQLTISNILVDAIPKTITGKIDRRFRTNDSSRISIYVAPRSRAEKHIVEAFQRVLGRTPLGVNASFFELGGNSLGAAELAVELGQFYAFDIVLGALQNSVTPASMARILEQGTGNQHLVALQPEGDQPTIFCVHAHMGHVYNLRALASRFAPDTPFYGIQIMADTPPRENTVDCFARHYLRHIKKHITKSKVERCSGQSGSFQLAGSCFGAWIAVEMGRQLQTDSTSPATLLLIGLDLPHSPAHICGRQTRISRLSMIGRKVIRICTNFRTQVLINRITHLYWLAAHVFGSSSLFSTLNRNPEFKCYIANRYYVHSPYTGPVHLYLSHEVLTPEITKLWHKWFTGDLKIIPVHTKQLLTGPAARHLADTIMLSRPAR